MDFYSRTRPNLIGVADLSETFKPVESGQTPLKDYFTDMFVYGYQNFIKENLLWILILFSICLVLYYRHKQRKEKYMNEATFNPIRRKTNAIQKPVYLAYKKPEQKLKVNPFPSVNWTPYDVNRAGRDYYTGGVNPYAGHVESNIGGVYGPSNYLSTTSSAVNFAAQNTVRDMRSLDLVHNYQDMLKRDIGADVTYGPDSLMNNNVSIDPPYST